MQKKLKKSLCNVSFLFLFYIDLFLNTESCRKQKNTLDGLNNNIEQGYSSLANISQLTQLEEDKYRQLKLAISDSTGQIKKLGKRLINTWLTGLGLGCLGHADMCVYSVK